MLNLCGSEMAAYWVYNMGHPRTCYKFAAGTGKPSSDRPSRINALKFVSSNPYAAYHFHQMHIEVFHAVILGWPLDSDKQLDPNCLMGVILARHGSMEESTRKGLHSHWMITQAVLMQMFISRRFAENASAIQQYILNLGEAIMCSAVPSTRYGRELGPLPTARPTNLPPDNVTWDSVKRFEDKNDFEHILRYCDLTEGSPDTKAQLLSWMDDCARAVALHWHHQTCKKNGCLGNDFSCRMEYIRMLVRFSHFIENGPLFLLQRDRGNFVPYILANMMAVPGNHTMSLIGEMSRWAREVEIWEREKKMKATQRERPRLPDPTTSAYLVTEYICSYNFKSEIVSINTGLLNICKALEDESRTDKQKITSVITKALNKINGSLVIGPIYALYVIFNGSNYHISYNNQIHNLIAFTKALRPVASNFDEESNLVQRLVVDSTDNVSFSSDVDDYRYRPLAMSALSPIEVKMAFEFGTANTVESHKLAVMPPHAECETHGFKSIKRDKHTVPQFISNPPPRPDADADNEIKDAYSSYALANFYSDRGPELHGTSSWDKMQDWFKRRPRGQLDVLALHLLENTDNIAKARASKKSESETVRVRVPKQVLVDMAREEQG